MLLYKGWRQGCVMLCVCRRCAWLLARQRAVLRRASRRHAAFTRAAARVAKARSRLGSAAITTTMLPGPAERTRLVLRRGLVDPAADAMRSRDRTRTEPPKLATVSPFRSHKQDETAGYRRPLPQEGNVGPQGLCTTTEVNLDCDPGLFGRSQRALRRAAAGRLGPKSSFDA